MAGTKEKQSRIELLSIYSGQIHGNVKKMMCKREIEVLAESARAIIYSSKNFLKWTCEST